jgi:hypothetical protein
MSILSGTLMVNAGSSALSGIILLVGSGPLSDWLGMPTPVSVVVGVGLLAFSLDVARTVRNLQRSNVLRVILADVAWVVAAAIVIIGYPGSLSTEGLWALGMITAAVATFAVLQAMGLRRMEVGMAAT